MPDESVDNRDSELDDLQEELIEEALEDEQDRLSVDNRSIFTIRDVIDKKADEARNDRDTK